MTDLQMTKRNGRGNGNYNRNKAALPTVLILFLALTAAGCGKTQESMPVELSAGSMEELQEGKDGESGEVQDDEGLDIEPIETQDNEEKDGESEKVRDSAVQPVETQDSGQSGAEDETVQAQSIDSEELVGNVYSVGQDSFVISKTEVWSEGDSDIAVGAAPGYEEEKDLITVHVAENCSYQYKTVKNGGVSPEDISTREGSFDDLEERRATHIKGSWLSDGTFLADSIEIMTFV